MINQKVIEKIEADEKKYGTLLYEAVRRYGSDGFTHCPEFFDKLKSMREYLEKVEPELAEYTKRSIHAHRDVVVAIAKESGDEGELKINLFALQIFTFTWWRSLIAFYEEGNK